MMRTQEKAECVDCGRTFYYFRSSTRGPRKSRCPECAKKKQKKMQKHYYQLAKRKRRIESGKVDRDGLKVCPLCGNNFKAEGKSVYCPECQQAIRPKHTTTVTPMRDGFMQRIKPDMDKKMSHLAERAAMAKAAGMNYGDFVAAERMSPIFRRFE